MFESEPFQKNKLQMKSGNGPIIYPKLKIGQPSDKYEKEADAVANQVMKLGDNNTMQMQPIGEEEELMQPKLRMQPIEEEEEPIQMKCAACEKEEEILQPKSDDGSVTTPSIERQIHSSKGSGTNLPESSNQFMSRAIGADFSGVKIHTDSNAVQMNRQLQARAFTFGSDIYFNSSEYSPESSNGKSLLAHELTHVVQQSGAVNRLIQCDRRGDRETDREEERGRRRRDTLGGRDRDRGLGGDLDSDWAGRAILGRWLTGSGDWTIINNSAWNTYMMNSALLRQQLTTKLHEVVNNGIQTADLLHQDHFAVHETFSAAVENGEGIIGYQYLHGTNADVGGFVIWGEGRIISLPAGQRMIVLNLNFQWNDMIDPNPQYQTDSIKSIIGEIITLGQAESYEIHISWPAVSTVVVDSSNNIVTSAGYPFY